MVLADGQVVFQRGNSTFTSSGIAVYNDVKDIGVPYNYRITSGDSPALVPLDLGDNTSRALAARRDLAAATAGNFLKVHVSGNSPISSLIYLRLRGRPTFPFSLEGDAFAPLPQALGAFVLGTSEKAETYGHRTSFASAFFTTTEIDFSTTLFSQLLPTR
jgi:hypothetical protein